MNKPRYKHGCSDCTFLGTRNEYDLYFCPQGTLPTVIARYGNEGHEYKSGMAGAEADPDLGEAKRLAKERGLVK